MSRSREPFAEKASERSDNASEQPLASSGAGVDAGASRFVSEDSPFLSEHDLALTSAGDSFLSEGDKVSLLPMARGVHNSR